MMRYQIVAKKSHEAKNETAKLKKVQDQASSSIDVKKSLISLCLSWTSSALLKVLILPCFETSLPFLVCACITPRIPEVLRNGFHLRLVEALGAAIPKKVPPGPAAGLFAPKIVPPGLKLPEAPPPPTPLSPPFGGLDSTSPF